MDYNISIQANDLAIQTNVEDLVCMICMNICFKPVLISCCERLMCFNCIKTMLKLSPTIKCPHCNNVNIDFVKPSKILNRMFENLSFNCPYKNLGCKEQIKYHFYFSHIYNLCEYNKNSEYNFCKICMEVYARNCSHTCDDKSLDDKERNLSLLEKNLDSLYKNNEENLNKIGGGSKNGSDKNITTNGYSNNVSEILPRGTILLRKLHNHKLILTSDRLNPGYEQGWVCELCNDNIRNPLTPSYHCEPCVYDICEKCYIYIASRVPNTSCHNHELNLEIRNLEWECNLCGKDYYMRRSWYCEICNFDACIFCYWK